MPPRSLEQALEGMQFPSDRSGVVEYARRHEVAPRSLEALEAIPDREYRDLAELFSALPPKGEAGRRRGGQARPGQEEAEGAQQPEAEAQAPVLDPMDAVMQMWRLGVEVWPEWVRLSQRLWFPWMR